MLTKLKHGLTETLKCAKALLKKYVKQVVPLKRCRRHRDIKLSYAFFPFKIGTFA